MIQNKKVSGKAWYCLIFGFMLIWFTQISPLIAYDGDDWLYLSYARKAIPIWKDWNPARVLPEVLMPFCGALAGHVLTPLTGDYFGSITLVSAVVVAGLITGYVLYFERLITRLFPMTPFIARLFSGLFLLLHFLVFRSGASENNYLFHCYDLTCYYYYLIPSLLNCILVMAMMAGDYDALEKEGSPEKKGVFLAVAYFAVFSNLPNSVILAIYAGGRIVFRFLEEVRGKFSWKHFLKSNAVYWLILAAWLLSMVFELNGGRADDDMGYRLSFLQGLKETLYRFLLYLKQHNRVFLMLTVTGIAGAAALWAGRRNRDEQDRMFFGRVMENLLCILVMFAAVIVLCAKVDITYIYRGEYLFGLYFYGFLILMMSLAYLLHRIPKLAVLLPLLVCILFSEINTTGKTFADSNLQNCDAAICEAVNNDILEQIVSANRAGASEMVLKVPVSGRPDGNWPHSDIVGNRIADTLYEHGLIDSPIQVTVEADMAMNEKYHVPPYDR